jgi:hypothetical protein
MDGAARAIDIVFIERLSRTLKYDHVNLNPAESVTACREEIGKFLKYYDETRPPSSRDRQTLDGVNFLGVNQRAA